MTLLGIDNTEAWESEAEQYGTDAPEQGKRRGVLLIATYTATILVSATLLFVVQPLFTRMALPLLGGTPAVWNTAVVFFQATLLAGYLYAHVSTSLLGIRRQAVLHLFVIVTPLLLLPIEIPNDWRPPSGSNPLPWLLSLLFVTVGLPFFVLSASSPMLQRWFAATGHRSAADPYFLYAASNVGSMLALLSYPVLVEPYLGLGTQTRLWAAGYIVFGCLTATSAILLWRSPRGRLRGSTAARTTASRSPRDNNPPPRVTNRRRLWWIFLASVPSSLMLGVTTYISTDLVSVPLLWVVPLSIYLLSFIFVFASKPLVSHDLMIRVLPAFLITTIISLPIGPILPAVVVVPLHLLTFFVAAMVCHGRLAQDRPPVQHLTQFYLWMSVGGVLGGAFNALLAPAIFTYVLEYPLAFALACMALPGLKLPQQRMVTWARSSSAQLARAIIPLSLFVVVLIGIDMSGFGGIRLTAGSVSSAIIYGLPILLCLLSQRGLDKFVLKVAVTLLVSAAYLVGQGDALFTERSFFGTHRVVLERNGTAHQLYHGTTLHGLQNLQGDTDKPLSYYYPSGPVGQLFAALKGREVVRSVAVVGLGSGSLACYAEPGQDWTYYEIDSTVEHIARNPRYFTYLRDCTPDVRVVLGDARLSLEAAPDHHYGLMILDAYSSDSVPVHLLTREAMDLYLRKLTKEGVVSFHISNRHFDLEPVLGNLAHDAELKCFAQADFTINTNERREGKSASTWVVLASQSRDLASVPSDPRWRACRWHADRPVWTDDFSSILSTFTWR